MGLVMTLWKKGLTSAQIARRVGGVSRSAVIGLVHRHGHKYGIQPRAPGRIPYGVNKRHEIGENLLKKIRASVSTKRQRGQRRSPLDGLPTSPLPPPSQTDIARVSMAKHLEGQCRFPVGDFVAIDAPWYCGDKIVPGLTYCEHHARRCYRVPDVVPRRDPPPAPATSTAARTRMRQTEPA